MAIQANTTGTDEDTSTVGAQVRQYLRSKGLDPSNPANVRAALSANARFSDDPTTSQAGPDPIANLRNYAPTPDAPTPRGPAAPRYNTGPADMNNVGPVVEGGPTADPATAAAQPTDWMNLLPEIARRILGGNGLPLQPGPSIELNPRATPQLGGPAEVPRLAGPEVPPQIEGPKAAPQVEGPPKQAQVTDQRDPMTRSLDKATQSGESPAGGANRGAPAAKPPVVELPGDNIRSQPAPPVEPVNPRMGVPGLAGLGMNFVRNARGGLPGLAIALGMSIPELVRLLQGQGQQKQ